jgi:hypothetical protein
VTVALLPDEVFPERHVLLLLGRAERGPGCLVRRRTALAVTDPGCAGGDPQVPVVIDRRLGGGTRRRQQCRCQEHPTPRAGRHLKQTIHVTARAPERWRWVSDP